MPRKDKHQALSVKNAELSEYSQNQQLNQWTIPSIEAKKIYARGMFDFISQKSVKTLEQSVSLDDSTVRLKLLSPQDVKSYTEKYNYIHIGCIQIAFKPLTLSGLNASILASIRDARCLDFLPSLMGIAQTSLCYGPVYFNIFPNLNLSLTDKNLFDAVTLDIQTQGYNFLPGSETINVIYRIYYKVMNTMCPNAILRNDPGKTTVIESNSMTTNIATPRQISWSEINFPEQWNLTEIVPPKPIIDSRVDQIIQNNEGDVEVIFAPNKMSRISLPRTMSMRESSSNPYRVSLASTRKSMSVESEVPSEITEEIKITEPEIRGVRISDQQIPHGIYANFTSNEKHPDDASSNSGFYI